MWPVTKSGALFYSGSGSLLSLELQRLSSSSHRNRTRETSQHDLNCRVLKQLLLGAGK